MGPAGEVVGLPAQADVALQGVVGPVEEAAGWWGLAGADPFGDHLAVGRGRAAAGLVEGGVVEKEGAGNLEVAAVDLLTETDRQRQGQKFVMSDESSTPPDLLQFQPAACSKTSSSELLRCFGLFYAKRHIYQTHLPPLTSPAFSPVTTSL